MIAPAKLFGRLGNSLFQYAFLYAYAKDNKIDWYYQDPKFFKGHEEEIRQLFGQNIHKIDMVAIHVRRGDYVNNPFYVDLSKTDYYEKAISQFKGEEFLVFSDNIDWCRRMFKGKEFTFSEGNSEIDDLNMMAGCKGIIIANSSFSWWGAFLGDQNKKVIAPKEWFTDTNMKVNLPKQWQRI